MCYLAKCDRSVYLIDAVDLEWNSVSDNGIDQWCRRLHGCIRATRGLLVPNFSLQCLDTVDLKTGKPSSL